MYYFLKVTLILLLLFTLTATLKGKNKSEIRLLEKNVPQNKFTNETHINNNTKVEEEYFNIHNDIIKTIRGKLENYLDGLNESNCKNDLNVLLKGISNLDLWALKMVDAATKIPSGLLHGSFYHLGNYDECLSQNNNNFNVKISNQYCLADVHLINNTLMKQVNTFKQNQVLEWALCIPTTCNYSVIESLLNYVFNDFYNEQPLATVKLSEVNCESSEKPPITTLDIIYSSIIGIFLLFIFLATLYHSKIIYNDNHSYQYYLKNEETPSVLHNLLIAFSVIFNVKKIMKIEKTKNENDLDCIFGIRVISMGLVLAGHIVFFQITGPIINSEFRELENLGNVFYSIFLNHSMIVDTFLFISGFLMCRLLLIELKKRNGKINVFVLYAARYLRLTPAYMVVLGFYCTYFYRLSDGPLWKQKIYFERERCLKSWWTNLLYINNYINTDQLCMFQSWYLSVDTQLFILAPLLIYPLWKKKNLGLFLLGISSVATMAVPFLFTYFYKLGPTLILDFTKLEDFVENDYFVSTYIKTHIRANPYIFGIVFGYVINSVQESNVKIKAVVRKFGWIFAIICGFGTLCSIVIFYRTNYKYRVLDAALYASLHRLSWCFAIGWTILMCITDTTSYINQILSWNFFKPLSKLTYCAYLVNGIVELYCIGTIRTPKYLSEINIFIDACGHLVLTIILAIILCVLFESPIHNLEKLIFKTGDSKQDMRNDIQRHTNN